MEIMFQDNLISYINSKTLDTFPRSVLLQGLKGSGKHLIVAYIAKHLGLNYSDISEKLDLESINNYYLQSEPTIYLIDADKLTIKNQNTILKFLEEPLKNSFIIILTQNKYNILETIRNRCINLSLSNYSKENLSYFIDKDTDMSILLDLAETPGELKILKDLDISKELDFIDKIFDKMSIAAFPNALTLTNHVGFKDEQDLISADIFIKIMRYELKRRISQGKNEFNVYKLTNNLYRSLFIPNIDKRQLFENYLSAL